MELASTGLPRTARRPRVQSPRTRVSRAQSPRRCRPRWACAQSPRKSRPRWARAQSPSRLGHASSSLPMSGASDIGCCLCSPVRRHFRCVEHQSALRALRGPPPRLKCCNPDPPCLDPANLPRTSRCSKRLPGNHRRLGGQRCRAPTSPGAILGLLEPSRARPLRSPGPRCAHQAADLGAGTGERPSTDQPRATRAGAPPDRPATLPFTPRLQTPARSLPVQSSLCLASPLYPLPRPHPTPACLCPAPSAFFLPLKSGILTATLESSLGYFRASLKSTRRPHNASAWNLGGLT